MGHDGEGFPGLGFGLGLEFGFGLQHQYICRSDTVVVRMYRPAPPPEQFTRNLKRW